MSHDVGANVFDVANPLGKGPVVIVCEHASKYIPDEFNNLGLDRSALESHIVWDPGALEVARHLSIGLDGPLVSQKVSRLVYDCNRSPDAADAIPEKSENYDIPGNRGLGKGERERRFNSVYMPFHDAVAGVIDGCCKNGEALCLLTIHSFTPIYFGRPRNVDIGILHDEDRLLADTVLETAGGSVRYRVRRNEPYGPEDGVTHTLKKHGIDRGIPNVMIEIRNDLVGSAKGQQAMAEWLLPHLRVATEKLFSIPDQPGINAPDREALN